MIEPVVTVRMSSNENATGPEEMKEEFDTWYEAM